MQGAQGRLVIAGQVGEHALFESNPADLPRRVQDRTVSAHNQRGLPWGVAGVDDAATGRRGGVAAGAGEHLVLAQQQLDVVAELHPSRRQQHQVVTDAFEVADQVGGDEHGQITGGDRLGQRGEEMPARQRVEGGDGLVQQQQPGLLGQRQRQSHLGALAARRRGDRPVQWHPTVRNRDRAPSASQRRLSRAPIAR